MSGSDRLAEGCATLQGMTEQQRHQQAPVLALAVLGVAGPQLQGLSTLTALQSALDAWKAGPLRQAYRAKAKAHHPDLHPEAEAAEHTQAMAEVNAAHTLLQSLKVQLRQPAVQRVHSVRYGHAWGSTASSTSTTTGYQWSTGWVKAR